MKRLFLLPIMMLVLITNQLYAQSNEGLWPSPIISGRDTIIVYPPQFESWNGNVLKGRSAVQYLKPGADEAFGIISFTTQTETSIPRSLVFINNLKIDECNFPALKDKGQSLNSILTQQLSEQSTIPLEQIKSGLANSQTNNIPTTDVMNEPPHVYYSSTPAVLLLVDGQPHKQKTESDHYERIINTSVFLLWNKEQKVYEASLFGKWFKSPTLDSNWTLNNKPDKDLKNILKSALMADTSIQTFDPPSQEIGDMLAIGQTPRIFANTGPSELLITDGTPRYEPINGTNLLYVTNTNVDLFKYVGDGMNYVLLSGRWFKAPNVNGKWTFVPSDQLPSDFNKIPEEHSKSNALVSVPGTAPAQEAVISSQIPQTATVDRQNASMQTYYDGNPQFETISGTNMQYAVNTNTPVIYYDNSYYAVTNGVWYNSMYPTGPWYVAVAVPQVIYTIPPSNPIYYVTYVRIYGYTPDVVYMGYTPGYYGCYVNSWGTVVYGTGYRYRPWLGNYWYGNPYSYGVGLSFGWSSWAGWSMGFGYGRAYYPVARPWWGPVAYGPNRNVFINHTQVNIYNYNHHNMIIAPSCGTNPRHYGGGYQHYGNTYHGNNNYQYYAGHDGHIYRTNPYGQWQHNNGNGWQTVNHNNGNQYNHGNNGNHYGWGNQGNSSNGNNGNHNGWNNQGNNSNGNNGNHNGWNNQGNNSNGNNGNYNGWNNQGNNSNGNNGNHNGWNNQGNNSNGNNGNHNGWNNQGNNSNGNNGNQNGNQNNQGNNGNHYGWNNQGNNSTGNNGNQNGNQNYQGNNGNHYGWNNQGNNSTGNNGNQNGNQNYQGNNGNHYGWNNQGNNSNGNQGYQNRYSYQNNYQQQHQARQLSQDRVQSQNNYNHVNSGGNGHYGGGSFNSSYRSSGYSQSGGGHSGGGYSGGGHSGGGGGYSRGGGEHHGGRR